MPRKTCSLLKRLWWTLAIRDAFGAALFGRPYRIDQTQCDADPIAREDFEYDYENDNDETIPQVRTKALYFISVTSLTAIFRRIYSVHSRPLAPGAPASDSLASLQADLEEWRRSIPMDMDWATSGTTAIVYPRVLSILYHNAILLAALPSPINRAMRSTGPPETYGPTLAYDALPPIVQNVAESILATTGILVTRDELILVPHELFTGLFLARVVLETLPNMGTCDDPRLVQCQKASFDLIFHQVKHFWEPAVWLTRLFALFPSAHKDCPSKVANEHENPGNPLVRDDLADVFVDMQSYVGDLSIFGQYWPSQPVLTGMFE